MSESPRRHLSTEASGSGVAQQLQAAMLTTLPEVAGLRLAACYVAVTPEESLGGDWFDAVVLPRADGTGDCPDDGTGDDTGDLTVVITVGDVTGHDIPAARVMSRARVMLRRAAFHLPDRGPGEVVTHFERACEALGLEARGTAVLARLTRSATGAWTMTWTSAGHPPPLLALPDGTVRRLELSDDDQGLLFGYRDLDDSPRRDCTIELPASSMVLFYSDGVIELPGPQQPGDPTDELGDVLLDQQARGPQAVVDAISMQFGSGYDDLVALAVQVLPPADQRAAD